MLASPGGKPGLSENSNMEEAMVSSLAARRFLMTLIVLFAALALALTAVGICDVVVFLSASKRARSAFAWRCERRVVPCSCL